MGQKRSPGLRKKGQIWHIDKWINGRPLRESTGTGSLEEASRYLAKRLEEVRQATVYGVRPKRTFRQAGIKFLEEHGWKRTADDDATHLRLLDPFIGDMEVSEVHDGSLRPFVQARLAAGRKSKTVNESLSVARRVLNLAATTWRDEHGLTWLIQAPKITLLTVTDSKKPYPLSWDEQRKLFPLLPPHLARMALYKVNTGCRQQEVCQLRWVWEQRECFVIPGDFVKNGEPRVVVLNSIARSVVEEVRGVNATFVFTYRGKPVTKMHNTAWKRAWKKAGLPSDCVKGVHNLKHTFGRRLRAAGVPLETRRVLLGHRNGDITTHYSAAEIQELRDAAELVCGGRESVLLREVSGA